MENNQNQTKKDTQKNIKGETISELAHRHLHNRNHTTTDEELRNARIADTSAEGLSKLSEADNNTLLPPLPFEKDNDTINRDTGSNTPKGSAPNPYNVLK